MGTGQRYHLFLRLELRQNSIYYKCFMCPAWSTQDFLRVREFFREGMGFRYLDALKSKPPSLRRLGWKDEILWHFTQQGFRTKTDAVFRVWGNYSHLCLARVMKGWIVKKSEIKGKRRILQAARRLWLSTSNPFSNQTPLRAKTINKELWAAARGFSAATSTTVNLLSSSSCLPCRRSTILPG